MKKISSLSFLLLFITSTTFADTPPLNPQNTGSIDPAKEREVRSKISVLQIPFIKNESQIKDSRVKYYANTFAGTVFITDEEIVYGLKGESTERGGTQRAVYKDHPKRAKRFIYRGSGLRSFVGA
ncbi:MAG: hypothetical protein NT096_08115 [Proteobacteria bacterium]|nr:hypothetical protein [Pseudomonadota bacterium]